MSASITPQYLLEGAVYALEQCGLLLRDANLLYRSGSYATAVPLDLGCRHSLRKQVACSLYSRMPVDGNRKSAS
jgi:hypothetical protein